MDRCSVSHAPRVNRWSAPYAVPSTSCLPDQSRQGFMQRFCPCGRHLPGEELHWSYHLTKRGMVFQGKLRMHHIGPALQRTSQLHHPQTCLLTTSPVRLLTLTKPYVQRAVSYTHLRAHETVLDLVCRLLL